MTHTPILTGRFADKSAAPAGLADMLASAKVLLAQALESATRNIAGLVAPGGIIDRAAMAREQALTHGLAWFSTYLQTLSSMQSYLQGLEKSGQATDLERLLVQVAAQRLIGQMMSALPISETEDIRLSDLGLKKEFVRGLEESESISFFLDQAYRQSARSALFEALKNAHAQQRNLLGQSGLNADTQRYAIDARAYVDSAARQQAQGWHMQDGLLPQAVLDELNRLHVFGLTIPAEHGGQGQGKLAMAAVTEELSRASLALGSVGTRSEIAAELLLVGGTDTQKALMLPLIAEGKILPSICVTEPQAGSDLGALKTTATKQQDGRSYVIDGQKLWCGNLPRSNMMVILARTDPQSQGYKGTSMFLAPKSKGDLADPVPDGGLKAERIFMPGYRGMGAYELGLNAYEVPAGSLLGGLEGQGFKHMMMAFEPARIQTAARGVGVARDALERALDYALSRQQGGRSIAEYPRIADKIAIMAAEIMAVRQLTYEAARKKDAGQRSDLEAGAAKMLSARVAFAAAADGVQIFGGRGFRADEPISRIFIDSKVLNIFEGAGEIQADIIARRLIEQHLENRAATTPQTTPAANTP